MRLYVSSLLFALVTALLIPISASAQTDADCLAVYDANGTRVARIYEPFLTGSIFLADQGRLAGFQINKNEIRASSQLHFTGEDCTGDAFMTAQDLQPQAYLAGTDVWYPDTMALAISRFSNSRKLAGSPLCTPESTLRTFTVPAMNFTLPTFAPPFHVEPEACFTPAPGVAALTPYGLGAMALVFAFSAYVIGKRRFATVEID